MLKVYMPVINVIFFFYPSHHRTTCSIWTVLQVGVADQNWQLTRKVWMSRRECFLRTNVLRFILVWTNLYTWFYMAGQNFSWDRINMGKAKMIVPDELSDQRSWFCSSSFGTKLADQWLAHTSSTALTPIASQLVPIAIPAFDLLLDAVASSLTPSLSIDLLLSIPWASSLSASHHIYIYIRILWFTQIKASWIKANNRKWVRCRSPCAVPIESQIAASHQRNHWVPC